MKVLFIVEVETTKDMEKLNQLSGITVKIPVPAEKTVKRPVPAGESLFIL